QVPRGAGQEARVEVAVLRSPSMAATKEAQSQEGDPAPDDSSPPTRVTRRFRDRDEVRDELANLLCGSLWLPLPRGPEDPDSRPDVVRLDEVDLVLVERRVIDRVRGRVV